MPCQRSELDGMSQYTKYMKKLKPIPMAEYQKMIKHFIILMLIVRR